MLGTLFLLGLLSSLISATVDYPKLTLPWGTWQATSYDSKGDFFTFSNVRFGRTTNGTSRFKASSYPAPIKDNSTVQDSSYGPVCYQVDITRPCNKGETIGAPNTAPEPLDPPSEDCLFLDIYVPHAAFKPDAVPLPVVVWFFGGAYLFGSKNSFGLPFYNGTGVLQAAAANNGKVIYIAGNYRVGAFGWLAGSYMEENALPNAGLYDQRLTLEWVRDYVHLVGGDNSKVSVWGESAGAGSILHHLIQNDGKTDPLFSKAILQSPAFQWQWSRTGTLDKVYNDFAELANCSDHSIECLQKKNSSTLAIANQQLFQTTKPCTGLFPVGPAIDGKLIKQLPVVALSEGNYWKGIESIIVSHVHDESGKFVPKHITDVSTFDKFLLDFFPEDELKDLRTAVQAKYPAKGFPYWGNQTERVADVIRDAVFTCNTRDIYDAYHDKANTYMLQYNIFQNYDLAFHGADLFPLYWNSYIDVAAAVKQALNTSNILANTVARVFDNFAPKFQAYFASHAIHGNPNPGRVPGTPEWGVASNDSNNLHRVMKTVWIPNILPAKTIFFQPITKDLINTNKACNFWKEAGKNITRLATKSARYSLTMQDLENAEHEDLR